eukprot:2492034-Pyramimonas_sp.AAC.1
MQRFFLVSSPASLARRMSKKELRRCRVTLPFILVPRTTYPSTTRRDANATRIRRPSCSSHSERLPFQAGRVHYATSPRTHAGKVAHAASPAATHTHAPNMPDAPFLRLRYRPPAHRSTARPTSGPPSDDRRMAVG